MIRHPLVCGLVMLAMVVTATGLVPGCARSPKAAPSTPPPPVYTGPGFLRGTVGSMARLRGYEPMLVSGWGMVVNLQGTGSTSVPAFLRQWMINEMRKQGVGSPRLAVSGNPLATMSPAQIIADPNTAAVEVFGLIPPGATKGTPFDLVVSAVEGTQTTSLEHGELMACGLSIGGSNRQMKFMRQQAMARGPVYVSPEQPLATDDNAATSQRRKAVIIGGGVVSEDRRIEMVLNQPSWQRSRDIADRINERFPKGGADRRETAVPSTDLLITINVPARYADDPQRLLALVSNLFIQRAESFELTKAQQLVEVLRQPENRNEAENIALAWEALGRPALPVLQQVYTDEDQWLALTALEAGSRLGDELASERLSVLAADGPPQTRIRAATILGNLPDSLRGKTTLRTLLDDPDDDVRLAAYRSLVRVEDPIIQRVVMAEYQLVIDPDTRREKRQLRPETFKFILDLVPSKRPLVYASQTGVPRLVIFDPMREFEAPLLARLWDNHLMLRADRPSTPAAVFYQAFGTTGSRTIEIAPTLANLAFLMAHKPTIEDPTEGLDLSYSQVVHAVYELCRSGAVDSPVRVESNPLIAKVEKLVQQMPMPQQLRPETVGQYEAPAGDQMPEAGPGFIDLPTGRSSGSAPEPAPVPEGRPDTAPQGRPDTAP